MKRSIGVLFFVACFIAAQAQEEKKQFIRKGLIRSMATISPGIMLEENTSSISIHGNLEYYVADNVSIKGDSYFFLNDNQNKFSANHATFAGASYHFKTKSHFDPYLGFQPGIALAMRKDWSDVLFFAPVPDYYSVPPKQELCPLISPTLGFNFYFQNLFHLFMETRYIAGQYLPDDGSPSRSLSELRFSFGLGFNLNLLKKK